MLHYVGNVGHLSVRYRTLGRSYSTQRCLTCLCVQNPGRRFPFPFLHQIVNPARLITQTGPHNTMIHLAFLSAPFCNLYSHSLVYTGQPTTMHGKINSKVP